MNGANGSSTGRVLGIETSCDETGLALFDRTHGLLAHALYSQVAMHTEYGGVVPELASRDHIHRVLPLLTQCLTDAQVELSTIDAIAYTAGPGLAGALLVGASIAAGLGFALQKPLIPVHHLEAHLLSPFLATPAPHFPFVALLISGGHSQFLAVRGVGCYELLGETVDDAAGEAFDKTAKLLGLGYPGGAALSELARKGRPDRFTLPRPMLHSGNLELSFSGLKTAVATLRQRHPSADPQTCADIARAFEDAVVEVLVKKSILALTQTQMQQLVVAGGVGANQPLRAALNAALMARQCRAYYPPIALCTDNGAMVAYAGAQRLESATQDYAFTVRPRWPLTTLATA